MTRAQEQEEGLVYSRFVPTAAGEYAREATEAHVRAHLSEVADTDDDPDTRSNDVEIEHRAQDDGVLIVGTLPGAKAQARYLEADHDPYAEVDEDLAAEAVDDEQPEEGSDGQD